MLNLIHLKYFQDAFIHGSLAESARRNYVSRPAISQAIRALEDSLGEKLVYHRRNRAQLTPKGKWLLAKSQDLLHQSKLIEQQIKGADPEQTQPVILCCSRSLAARFLGGNAKQSPLARASFPIDLRLGDAFFVRRALEANEADFGIAVDDGNFQAFSHQVIHKGSFQIFEAKSCLKKHLLIGDKGPEVAAFMNSPASAEFTRITTIQSWEVMASLASQGAGRAWIPDFLQTAQPKLRSVTLKGLADVSYQVLHVARHRKQMSENAKALLQWIIEKSLEP